LEALVRAVKHDPDDAVADTAAEALVEEMKLPDARLDMMFSVLGAYVRRPLARLFSRRRIRQHEAST
jgi:hypothetical protein